MSTVRALACLAVAGLVLGSVPLAQAPVRPPSPARQFEQAVTLMDSRGDYEGAARLFEAVAASADRALAARALVFLGTCYERVGDEKARQAYERVLAQYADQRAAAAQARARLAVLQRHPGPPVSTSLQLRRLWNPRPFPGAEPGYASLDGRVLALIDPDGQLAFQDLRTGTVGPRFPLGRAAGVPPCEPYWIQPVPSPDANEVAFKCYREGQPSELRVARVNGGRVQERAILRVGVDEDVDPLEWRRSGYVLARVKGEDRSTALWVVPATGGEARMVVRLPFESAHASLSPDGRWVAYDGPDASEPPRRDVFVVPASGGSAHTVATGPTDDLMPTWVADGSSLVFVSDRTGSSGLWLQPMTDGRPVGSPRLLTADLGRIAYPMGLASTGAYVYFRQTGLVDVQVVDLDDAGMPTGPPTEAGTRYVGGNMFPAWSSDGTRLAYRTELGISRVHTIGVRDLRTATERIVAPALGWLDMPRWSPDGRRFLVRGRGVDTGHGLYVVDAETGRTTPVKLMSLMEEDRLGSAQWEPGGEAVVYIAHRRLIRHDLQSGSEAVLLAFDEKQGVQVVPDPGFSISPVDGSIAFAWWSETAGGLDTSLRIRAPDGSMREVLRSEPGERVAGVAWLPDNRGLIFTRTKTGDALPDEARWPVVWQVDLRSGVTRSLGISMRGLRNIAVSPDGRRLAFTSGWPTREPWILENFLPPSAPARARAKR
jgi:Tol biopolymer transport system component